MSRVSLRTMSRRSMIAGSGAAIVATSLASMPAACRGKIYPGATVHGIDVSGNTAETGVVQLREAFAGFERLAVTYRFGDETWSVGLADLGVSIEYELMIEQALDHGRSGSLVGRYAVLIAERGEASIPLSFRRDERALRSTLTQIGDQIALAPQDAALELTEGAIEIVEDVSGRELDFDAAIAASLAVIERGESGVVELTTLPVVAEVRAADLAGASEAAFRLVSEAVHFTHDGLVYPIDTGTLTAALNIENQREASLDIAKLEPRLDIIARAVYYPAQNVKLGWDAGPYVVANEIDGRQVDRDALSQAVLDLAQSTERTAPLPVKPVRAAARADNIADLGIEDHLAYGSSSFAGSSFARAENVAVSARNISFKLVAPGETFSFNQLLGPITLENGFVEGSVINGDFAATDIGGGVCQVSTTVFRAAARAGFRFSEWHPHTWRLAFYEADGSPPGFDGAIYQPNSEWEYEMDLRFTNPLDSWLLLQVLVSGDTVAAHFYGQPPGWDVQFGEARLSEPKPIPEPVERINPRLGSGERVQVQSAQAGVTVSLRRTVTDSDGTVIADGDFVSDYQSVPEVWEVGSA